MNGGESDVEKTVTEIWYSTLLSEGTYQCLRASLLELTGLTSAENLLSNTAGLIRVEELQFQQLQDVWKTWLGLRVTGTKWIRKQREELMKTQLYSPYTENVPAQHAASAKRWIEQGVFKRTPGPTFAENPTMTGVDSKARYAPYSYSVPESVFPFSGWDYQQVKKFKSCNCLVTMYGDYIECILRNTLKMFSKKQISVQVILSDCMDIQQHLEVNTLYDRILTSNLMDYVFLPNLLKLCSEMLNHDNDQATIITETILWSDSIMPEGDVSWPPNMTRLPKLTKIASEDTKRSFFANDGGISVREYLDNSREFLNYLRAMFYAYRLHKVAESKSTGTKSTIPGIKELANEFKLQLRDGIRNENRIVFYKPAINRRRVNFMMGRERFLEWIPLKKE
ncbi:uncharacterized protein LOC114539328 [Dendronephthya gigantea]|uniref:uncharacterized protein LOC114539328 n=1 Tax=Dendronephthya gigantea TaxID=151771 RepID=UPI00106B4A3B|nr:uncharacterized protein LOC114539328 [Dendronephthya gigantea]